MAIVLVNKDGSHNAKVGDIVVTGGGLFEKTASGISKRVGDLYTSTGRSTSYDDVVAAYNKLTGGGSSKGDTGQKVKPTAQDGKAQDEVKVKSIDENGIIEVETYGYNPADYFVSGSSGGSTNISTVLGYVVLGLVGVALLDRFMNGGGQRG